MFSILRSTSSSVPFVMFLEPFEGPFLKLERAGTHLVELTDMIQSFGRRARPEFVKTDRLVNPWELRISEQPPAEVPLIVSDIAHSLRSALDVMTCDIALIRDVGLSDMKYPFFENEEAFQAELSKRDKQKPFVKLGADVVEKIAASMPYKGAQSPIRELHDLNNQDKHRMLVPAVTFASTTATLDSRYNNPKSPYYRPDRVLVSVGGHLVGLRPSEPLISPFPEWDPHDEYIFNDNAMRMTFPSGYVITGEIATVMRRLVCVTLDLIEDFRRMVLPG